MKRAIASLLLAAMLSAPCAAFADNTSRAGLSEADLKTRGDNALSEKRYEDALADYEAAYAKNPNPALLFNRGRALQFLARYPEALTMIEQFAQKAPPDLLARVRGLQELLTDLRSKVATITISCSVPGARVLIGQRQVAVTPVSDAIRVNAGNQTIDAFADGYFPYHKEEVLPGSQATALEIVLTPRDRSGLLTVKSAVKGVEVKVDDFSIGLAPAEVGVLAGLHRVDVMKEGYGNASTQIAIQVGEHKELSLDPIARAPIYTRWWFWTGVAVVAAGVVTIVVARSTEKSAPNGDFSPGQVRF